MGSGKITLDTSLISASWHIKTHSDIANVLSTPKIVMVKFQKKKETTKKMGWIGQKKG